MDAIIGIIVAAAAGVISIWKGLLIYNEATKLPLVGGGVFGLLLGAYLGSFLPDHLASRYCGDSGIGGTCRFQPDSSG